ncbi:MAG: DUF1573 domain-containing protein [Rikenellaceae bacterium]|nr:DUF1573 domain-containing protein [Rikenellaceae bacterium]
MRRLIALTAAVSCIAVASAASPLKFESESRNLGRVARKSRTETVFRFVNDTQAPVVITGAKSPCGCTKVRFPSRPVMPHATDSLTVVFNATERGAFYKKITIATSSGQQTIAVRGTVE